MTETTTNTEAKAVSLLPVDVAALLLQQFIFDAIVQVLPTDIDDEFMSGLFPNDVDRLTLRKGCVVARSTLNSFVEALSSVSPTAEEGSAALGRRIDLHFSLAEDAGYGDRPSFPEEATDVLVEALEGYVAGDTAEVGVDLLTSLVGGAPEPWADGSGVGVTIPAVPRSDSAVPEEVTAEEEIVPPPDASSADLALQREKGAGGVA